LVPDANTSSVSDPDVRSLLAELTPMTHCGRSLVVALFFADYVGGHVTSSIQEIMVSIEGGRSGAGDGTVRLCRKSPRLSSM
jgi:hypothetical protein